MGGETGGALAGLTVLDLSGPAGQYCGKQFADLGAEVILVEPVHGSPVRRVGPFLDERPHIEYSLPFTYLNGGKRSIALDLDQPDGQRILRALVESADLLIETEKPGTMTQRGIDYAALSSVNERLVMASVTPFGQSGPYAQYQADDLIGLALGGLLYLGGYADTPPVAVHGNQAYLAASQFASVAAMIALLGAEQGKGCHIDVSVQECVVMAMENAIQFYDLEGTVRKRGSGQQLMAGVGVFPCADGEIYLMAGGIASTRFWLNTVNWLLDEGVEEAAQLADPQWEDPDYLTTPEARAIFNGLFTPFAREHAKTELYHAGQARRIPICPINTPKDILESRQLAYRKFFVEQYHTPSNRTLTVPGAPYRLEGSPWRQAGPAPRLGEHTHEILARLGYDFAAQAALLKSGVIN